MSFLSQGIDGSFYHLDFSKKNSGLKLKQDSEGIAFSDTIKGKHTLNDSLFDFIQYASEYSIDTLIEALMASGSLKNENYKFKSTDLRFLEGLARVYGSKLEYFQSSVVALKCMLTHSQDGF
jgi:hypothetical protein